MSKAIACYVDQQKPNEAQTQGNFKYGYIWTNLDNLCQQLTQEEVNDLNLKFIGLALDKIKEKK